MILNPSLPAPSLPDAGRPFVDSCTFDAATRNVNVRARNAQAGEVKTPEGEAQSFPIAFIYKVQVTNYSGETLSFNFRSQKVVMKNTETKVLSSDMQTDGIVLGYDLFGKELRSRLEYISVMTVIESSRITVMVSFIITDKNRYWNQTKPIS